MVNMIRVDNPANGEIVFEIPLLSEDVVPERIEKAHQAHLQWRETSLDDRIDAIQQFIGAIQNNSENIAKEITLQMGKPLEQAKGEVSGLIQRAEHMCAIAPEVLSTETLPELAGFHRMISREPVGVVLDIAAWNYPLLVAVNAVVPAVLAGNAVLIKHSPRTPRCAEHFVEAFGAANIPNDLVQSLHVDHLTCAQVMRHPAIGAVSFTGSVRGGREVYKEVATHRFIDVGLELGGKDPAYVCDDADLSFAVPNIVGGALYNSGQSCCAVERVYVHRSQLHDFINAAVAEVEKESLGDPMDPTTTMGPMALPNACDFLTRQVEDALSKGARALTGGRKKEGPGRFFQPTILVDVDHSMDVMREESFGPIIAIMPVDGDEEALTAMNDSPFGLTASVWTSSEDRAMALAQQIRSGTVFMNRCDYLDPALPWSGTGNSGKGSTLSRYGFDTFTQLKSYHFRTKTS